MWPLLSWILNFHMESVDRKKLTLLKRTAFKFAKLFNLSGITAGSWTSEIFQIFSQELVYSRRDFTTGRVLPLVNACKNFWNSASNLISPRGKMQLTNFSWRSSISNCKVLFGSSFLLHIQAELQNLGLTRWLVYITARKYLISRYDFNKLINRDPVITRRVITTSKQTELKNHDISSHTVRTNIWAKSPNKWEECSYRLPTNLKSYQELRWNPSGNWVTSGQKPE